MATSVDRIFGYSSLSAFRLPVRVATTANITLSGEQTVDGVSVVAGDRVLVKDQTDGTENGVYVAATGAWTRAEDFNGARDVVEGTMILCNNGSTQAGTIFRLTNSSPVIGSTSLTFESVITIGESGLQVGIDIQAYSTVLQTLANAGTLPTVTVTDLNDATADSFIYAGAGAANAPSGLSASAINGIVSAQGTDDLIQLVFGQSVTRLYMRAKNGGVWSSWERFLRFSDVLDEDDMASNDPDRPPSQQSIKVYADAIDAKLFGFGQTWQDVSGSRAHSTSYQNTTGRPIAVYISSSGGTARDVEVSDDDATWVVVGRILASASDIRHAEFIVPDQHYYRVNGAATIGSWSELR